MKPNFKIGILGGGQLGRMLIQAASRLGISCSVFTPEENSPASQICDNTIVASYTDTIKLEEFANSVDVVTFEFENIPLIAAQTVEEHSILYPHSDVLRICQNRILEKMFLYNIGVPTADYRPVYEVYDIQKGLEDFGPSILKTATMGYDGKGQMLLTDINELPNLDRPYVLEKLIDFDFELSVTMVRDKSGQTFCYFPVMNEHEHGILRKTVSPAILSNSSEYEAYKIANKIANEIGLIGVMTVEMFMTKDGNILVNELAPRPHNSAHWTIDACDLSQFDMCVRAISDLPIRQPIQNFNAVMINILGDEIRDSYECLNDYNAFLHLYGKKDVRPGRKMGHITLLTKNSS